MADLHETREQTKARVASGQLAPTYAREHELVNDLLNCALFTSSADVGKADRLSGGAVVSNFRKIVDAIALNQTRDVCLRAGETDCEESDSEIEDVVLGPARSRPSQTAGR